MKIKLIISLLAIVGFLFIFSRPLRRVVKYLDSGTNRAIMYAADAQNPCDNQFPIVSGLNLLGEQFELPKDFSDNYNLVILAYTQEHQYDVYTWLPILAEIEASFSDFQYYELPTLPSYNPVFRAQVDGWMIEGIPDEETRSRTVTLYLDVDALNASMNIESTQNIQILLISAEGKVLWRESGAFSENKGISLRSRLRELSLIQL
ncbi:MAG: hypothetical protein AAGG53_07585 [Cyanobacteria bacterium P01_H01_bin.152]